jgi:cobalt-zinc-cadmium efflux system outer membrane protein
MSIRQLFVLASFALALQAQAEVGTSDVISLDQALQAARENLEVALARRSLAAAQADILSANRSPFPSLTAKVSQLDLQHGFGDGDYFTEKHIDKSLGVDWTWERGNKRELRTLSAQRAAAAAQADLEDITTRQLLDTQASFFELLAAQERLSQVSLIERSAVQLAASAQKRVDAGDLAAQDAARTEIEAQRAGSDVQLAELDRQRAALTLWQLTGLPTPPETLKARADWPDLAVAPTQNADLAALVEGRADVRAAQARVLAAQATLDGSSAQKYADITWGASYDHFPGTSTALVELRMQMPLQWGYSYQGEIGRAAAQLALAQDALEKLRRQARVELQRLQHEALSTAQRARIYENNILPRARKVAEGAELAFSKGAMSLTDLLDARRTLRATLLDALAARTEYARAAGAWQLRTQADASSPAPTASNDFNK